MDAGVEAVDDPDAVKELRTRSTSIHVLTLVNAAVVTVLFWTVATFL